MAWLTVAAATLVACGGPAGGAGVHSPRPVTPRAIGGAERPSPEPKSPQAPPCNPGQTGSGIEPALILIGCGTTADYVNQITWTAWKPSSATGTALHNLNDCRPDCAHGRHTSYRVEVTLDNPGLAAGSYTFRTIVLRPMSTGGAGGEAATLPTENWGWAPSGE